MALQTHEIAKQEMIFVLFRNELMTLKYNIKIASGTQTPFKLNLQGSSKFCN